MSEAIPSSWTEAEIGELCDLINGRAFKPTDWTDVGLAVLMGLTRTKTGQHSLKY